MNDAVNNEDNMVAEEAFVSEYDEPRSVAKFLKILHKLIAQEYVANRRDAGEQINDGVDGVLDRAELSINALKYLCNDALEWL
jgi:hypothetical protein